MIAQYSAMRRQNTLTFMQFKKLLKRATLVIQLKTLTAPKIVLRLLALVVFFFAKNRCITRNILNICSTMRPANFSI